VLRNKPSPTREKGAGEEGEGGREGEGLEAGERERMKFGLNPKIWVGRLKWFK
jgi:hypothetical protein